LNEGLADNVIITVVDSQNLVKDDQEHPNKYIKFEAFKETLKKHYEYNSKILYQDVEEYDNITESSDTDITVKYYKYTKKLREEF
jgi:hypothetical protein